MKQKTRFFLNWVRGFGGENDAESARRAAKAIKISYSHCRNLMSGRRFVTVDIADAIHKESGGRFHREALLFGRNAA